jgi:multidrug efflux pump subunit AcrB
MGIVRFALRFPHTFYVMAIAILFLGVSAAITSPKDIFPPINIPVVTVIWQYTGLSPEETDQRLTTYSEYAISTSVNDIKTMEGQSLEGVSVIKVYFQPNVNIDLAISQIVSATNAIRSLLPPGTQPPIVVQYNASSVPVLQLSLSSDQLNEQQLYDYGIYQLRQALAPIQGITLPTPYGGKYRQIMVYLNPGALHATGISPNDVLNAVNAQSLTLPSGDAKIGDTQYIVRPNTTAPTIDALNHIPLRQVGPRTVLLRDVAQVADAWSVQQNIVRTDGRRAVLLTIIKNGDASTLDVVSRIKAALPDIRAAAPPGMNIDLLFDQSVFVQAAITSVLREGAIAAGLTALTILIFLGSWRSTLIVMVSIPLSILTSVAVMWALGQTINTMTLGGLALAVGILVDDSTVAIENTHRLFEERVEFDQAVLEGSAGIALPTLVSTLAICSVFVSVFFLQGAARYLFTPLGLSVVFAMLASYTISRTLTPIIIRILLRSEQASIAAGSSSLLARFHERFNRGFDRFREVYTWVLTGILRRRATMPLAALSVLACAGGIAYYTGTDFFPQVDAGLIQLHVRAPARTRIERTEQYFQDVEDEVRRQIPKRDLGLILDNIGLPARVYNFAFTDGTGIGVNDGQILISLNEGHAPTADYIKRLRVALTEKFPDILFYFQPADIVTQILNFGIPSQIDVQLQGRYPGNRELIGALRERMAKIPGLTDVHVQQELDAPEFYYDIDRTRAQQVGYNVTSIVNNMNISLSSSEQVAPNFWTDPRNGIPYYFAVQTPEYRINSLNALNNTPISSTSSPQTPVPNLLGNVGSPKRMGVQSVYNQSNIQRVYDVYANVQDSDLGRVSEAISQAVSGLQQELKPGNRFVVRGQIESMNGAFNNLTLGLIFAAVFVYLLMVVNFQSFLDPLVILLALPGAGAGILLMLLVTGTTLSVPSLMGAIMSIGVASANSILLVSFAREMRQQGASAFEAAIQAGRTRIRPVLMTAAAMVAGMIPMAIGAPGEEQNAVLARAVIGGVLVGTMTTLLFVPYLYSILGRFETRTAEPNSTGGEGLA